MTLEELYTLLTSITGMADKIVLYDWPVNDGQLTPEESMPSGSSAPAMPYICYRDIEPAVFSADGVSYYSAPRYQIELYTESKDPQTEALVESALTASGIYWQKTPMRIEDSEAYETIYTI